MDKSGNEAIHTSQRANRAAKMNESVIILSIRITKKHFKKYSLEYIVFSIM